jgi:hypothetical protein
MLSRQSGEQHPAEASAKAGTRSRLLAIACALVKGFSMEYSAQTEEVKRT